LRGKELVDDRPGLAWPYRGDARLDSSPYLYLLGIAAALKSLGATVWAARLFGVMTGAAAVIAAGALAAVAGKDRRAAVLAAGLMAVTPAFIQGALILDVDCTILVVLALFMAAAVFLWARRPGIISALILIAAAALMLWGRVTTPWIFIVTTGIWALCFNRPALFGRRTWACLGLGGVLFLCGY
jgi:hypothetical protein